MVLAVGSFVGGGGGGDVPASDFWRLWLDLAVLSRC